MDLTHASFFSGVGGLDLGLERAGWRTVSFSEIDPYACAVLAQRWPDIPNLGDIVAFAGSVQRDHERDGANTAEQPTGRVQPRDGLWRAATLWTGGFPCQDLSVAGKRRGMGTHDDRVDSRSGLAYAFLDLVERYRPPAVLLENVPGLLSSHGGRDMAALLGRLVELGYGVGYRVLDARHFGVPQRRRRVFILGVTPGGRAGAERAAEVLSVGSRCHRHPPAGVEAGPGVAAGTQLGVDIARAVTGPSGKRHDDDTDTLIANGLRASDGHHGYSSPRGDGGDNLVSTSPDPDRVRAPHGLAGRPHDRGGVADTLREHPRPGSNSNGALTFVKHTRGGINHTHGHESWGEGEVSGTLDSIGQSARTATAVVGASGASDDPLLPLGLDSHRYRCCGNGVVSDVSFWLGTRLAAALR